jgi:hypothetical protein
VVLVSTIRTLSATNIKQNNDKNIVFFTLGNINMTEYWDAIEDSLSPLSTNSGDWLTIVIDGVTYVADTANITKGANLECSSGYFLQDEYDICGMFYLFLP